MESDLLNLVQRKQLTVIDYTSGQLAASELVAEGEANRFELQLLEWDGTPAQAWRDDNPGAMLELRLGQISLREAGAGYFKMRLIDRFGGYPHGETVTFLTTAPSGELAAVLLQGESEPDEFELALFGNSD